MNSIIIPSVGRRSLLNLVASIQMDVVEARDEIAIVVALNGELSIKLPKFVQVIKVSDKPIGVAKTVNAALEVVDDGIVWMIADDDEWLPGKLLRDLTYIRNCISDTILVPMAFLIDEMGTSVRPQIPIHAGQSIFDYLFSKLSFIRNPRYITLSGACASKKTWSKVKFQDESSREDLIYLHRQQQLNTELIQSEVPSVKLHVSIKRSSSRDQSDSEAAPTFLKSYLSQRQAVVFLNNSIFKVFGFSGKSRELMNVISRMFKIDILRYMGGKVFMVLLLGIIWFVLSLPMRLRSAK